MNFSRYKPHWRRFRQVVLLVWDGFWDDHCSLAASSLAYQTALALVPLLAIALALLKASGQLEAGSGLVSFLVKSVFPSSPEAQQEVVERLSSFSGKLTAGGLGSFGLITSSVIGFLLFLSIESIWNRIWDSQRERGYIERFLYFYTGITLAPFIAAISFIHTARLWEAYWMSRILSIAATSAGITLINRFTPTQRVEWRPALIGGVTSALLFEFSKWSLGLYLSFISGKYRSIYGALGVLPLFLLSIYLWWVILLIGAEVCRSVQRLPLLRQFVDRPRTEDSVYGKLRPDIPTINGPLAARLLCDVAQYWKAGKKAIPIVELEQRHGLPESLVRRVMHRLGQRGLVAEIDDNSYLLSRPPESIRLDEVLRLFHDFAPPSFDHDEPDALDKVLQELNDSVRNQTRSVTFAHLV